MYIENLFLSDIRFAFGNINRLYLYFRNKSLVFQIHHQQLNHLFSLLLCRHLRRDPHSFPILEKGQDQIIIDPKINITIDIEKPSERVVGVKIVAGI